MEADILGTVGQMAGIGGVALGIFLLLFRDIIRKAIFPQLGKKDAYRLLRLISILVFLIAAIGIGAWVWTESDGTIHFGNNISAECSSVSTGSADGASVNVDCGENSDAS